ncbi:GxxExxY protein [Mangrovivirga sp. M17]|uniref:GxxExxY protein n=1 Tax=Mangrovivirga halotolerans TaxID=2993936 RepID=A0ABT3RVE1_9BACT|nr:GxxExxY protein [Mangrovivirga halotolerans]MCX2745207.1 GxxExxY protein [Mangrovivirga halotolerans]
MSENEITSEVIRCSIEVHKELGPGLLESIYEECLIQELIYNDIKVLNQVSLPVYYKGNQIDTKLRLDLLIEESVIVEVKSVKEFDPVHTAQIMSYLKLTDLRVGLLINFNVLQLKSGLKRIVNGF